jgi:N4-gp56 family major capsid protein
MAGETSAVYPTANAIVDKTAAATFIPEIWSDEVIAAYQKNLKMSPLVKKISMTGKKGDTIHIPKPVRGAASAKAESTAVTIQANLESELQVVVDRHFEYSRFIEDIVETQALNSLRQFYTEDAGYQLALKVDTDLMNAGTGFGDGTKTFSPANTGADWVASNSYYSNAGSALAAYAADTVATGDNFSDVVFRALIKLMDDADVPMENRALIVPPAARSTIMGIDRYVSSDFVGGRGVESGLIGNLYGVDVYVSSNCPVIEAAAQNSASSLDTRGCLFFHKDAIVHAEQMAVRSQTQYKQEYLSTLYTADTLYGVEVYRPEAGFVLAIADE